MGKLITFTFIMSGLVLLFYLTGLIPKDSSSTGLLTLLSNPSNLQNLELGSQVILGLSVAGAASLITIGFITRDSRLVIAGPFMIYLFNLLWAYLAVFDMVFSESPIVALILFSPLLIVYCITAVEWLIGQDT